MTAKTKRMPASTQVQSLFSQSPEMLKDIVNEALEEILEKEMSEALGAAPASPQPEEHESARAAERGNQTAHARRSHLPELGLMPAAGPSAVRGDARRLAGGPALHQHGLLAEQKKELLRQAA